MNALKTQVVEKEGEIKDQKIVVANAINNTAIFVKMAFVLMYTVWIGFGFILSKIWAGGHVPVKPTGVKAKQSVYLGHVVLSRDAAKSVWCRVSETIGAPTVDAGYYPANPDLMKTKSLSVTPAHLGVPTHWKLTPVNGVGDGPESDPFGGTYV